MIFWSITIISIILGLIGGYLLLGIEGSNMFFGLSFAVYIFCAILSFRFVNEFIPFAIKLGATRKNIFISIGMYFLTIGIGSAVFVNILHEAIMAIAKQLSITTFQFIHPAQLLTNTWMYRVVIDIAFILLILVIMYLIGLLFYKYGLIGAGSVISLIGVLTLFGFAQGILTDLLIDLVKSMTLGFHYQIMALAVILYCMTWIFMKKITISKVG